MTEIKTIEGGHKEALLRRANIKKNVITAGIQIILVLSQAKNISKNIWQHFLFIYALVYQSSP